MYEEGFLDYSEDTEVFGAFYALESESYGEPMEAFDNVSGPEPYTVPTAGPNETANGEYGLSVALPPPMYMDSGYT